MEAMGADGSLLVQVPAWHYADPQLPADATSLPLRDALERCYDLRQPKPELLQLLHDSLAAAAAAPGAGAEAGGGHLQQEQELEQWQEPMLLPAIGKLRGKQQHVRGKDSASELSAGPVGAAMAHGLHERLCGQGCVADRLEVRQEVDGRAANGRAEGWAAASGRQPGVQPPGGLPCPLCWVCVCPVKPATKLPAWRPCLHLPLPLLPACSNWRR